MTTASADSSQSSASEAHEQAVDLLMADRAMASRMLREHQALRESTEYSPAAACLCDAEGRLIVWSDAFERLHADTFAGDGSRIANGEVLYPELIRRHIETVYPPEDAKAALEAHLDARRKADGTPAEHDYGAHGVFRVSSHATSDGSIMEVATCIDDIRDREANLIAARLKAEESERIKGEFLANMSHEIRTPMSGILGMVEILDNSGLNRKQQLYTDVIARSGEALMTVIDDILDLSKIETGQITLQPASFDLAETMEDSALLFASSVSDSGIDLIVRIDPTLPRRMIGDAGRLRQIVSNLLGNAIKSTEAGHVFLDIDGTLHERADGREIATLTIVVQDTGNGLPTQAPCALGASASRGGGLGLSIATGLVEVLGGSVETRSIEDQGTTVTVTLDLPVDAGRIITRTKDTLRGKRVVMVDIPTARCTILTELLNAWGFETAACTGPRESVALLNRMAELGAPAALVILGNTAQGLWEDESFLDVLRNDAEHCPPVIVLDSLDRIGTVASDPMVFASLPCPGRSSHLLDTIERALTEERPKLPVPAPQSKAGIAAPAAPYEPMEPESDPEPGADDVIAMDSDDTGSESPEPEERETAASPLDTAEPDSPETVDILVAEDNEINQFLLEQILSRSGYTYRLASDGKAALEAWRTYRPRIILMDVSMPDMSGDEATAAIREAEKGTGQHVPIIAVTAHALRGDRDRFLEIGMDDYLSKPVKSVDIVSMIEKWITDTDEARLAG